MDLGLRGKIAVVTSASKGIGLAVTLALTDEGTHVVAGSRSRSPELERLENAGLVSYAPVDLSTPDGPTELISRAEQLGGSTSSSTMQALSLPGPRASSMSPMSSGWPHGRWV